MFNQLFVPAPGHPNAIQAQNCIVCGMPYYGRGVCTNWPRCPRRDLRGPWVFRWSLYRSQREWASIFALIARARHSWRMIRISFWQGIAANYFINKLRRYQRKKTSFIRRAGRHDWSAYMVVPVARPRLDDSDSSWPEQSE